MTITKDIKNSIGKRQTSNVKRRKLVGSSVINRACVFVGDYLVELQVLARGQYRSISRSANDTIAMSVRSRANEAGRARFDPQRPCVFRFCFCFGVERRAASGDDEEDPHC